MGGIIALAVLIAIVYAVLDGMKGGKAAAKAWPVKSKRLVRDDERLLLMRLEEALPDHRVFPQVAMSQFIDITNGKEHQWARNKIFKKVVDFAVCNEKLNVVAVVELDGSSHRLSSRKRSDADKDNAVAAAGIKMVRISSSAIPKGPEIRALVGVENEQRKVA